MKGIFAVLGYFWIGLSGLAGQTRNEHKILAAKEMQTATIVASDLLGILSVTGSGFFVSDDGLLATARHVVHFAVTVSGKTSGGEDFKVLGVLAEDPVHDLVILITDRKRTAHMPLGSFEQLRPKQEVHVAGNIQMFNGEVRKGVIRQIENLAGDYQWYAIDANVVEGMSGSPVVNSKGEVVGLITGQLYDHTAGFVVSVDSIKKLLKETAEKPVLIPITKLKVRPYSELFDDLAFKASIAAFRRNDHKEAVRRIEETMVHFPDCAVLYALKGSFYSAMKSWTQAEQAYHRAIELKPKYAMAWAYLGAVILYQGRGREAIEASITATQLRPDLPEAWLNLGSTYALSKRYEEARKVLKQLRSIEGENAAQMASALETLLARTEPKK